MQAMIEAIDRAGRPWGRAAQERPAPHPPRRGDCKPPRILLLGAALTGLLVVLF